MNSGALIKRPTNKTFDGNPTTIIPYHTILIPIDLHFPNFTGHEFY